MNTNSLIIRDSVPKDHHQKKKKLGDFFLTLGRLGCAGSVKKSHGCCGVWGVGI